MSTHPQQPQSDSPHHEQPPTPSEPARDPEARGPTPVKVVRRLALAELFSEVPHAKSVVADANLQTAIALMDATGASLRPALALVQAIVLLLEHEDRETAVILGHQAWDRLTELQGTIDAWFKAQREAAQAAREE